MFNEYENSKESICNDLSTLADLLNHYDLCKDTSSLYKASNLKFNTENENWRYSVNIPISINTIPAHIRPVETDFIEIYFSIEIEGQFINEINIKDLLNKLELDIVISGLTDAGVNFATWHLDKHVGIDGDGDNKFTHPEYHFSFGGSKMWDQNIDYGGVLLHPSPRIPHPPMDVILGVDFILQNFVNRKDIYKLIDTPEYKNIVRNSQIRLWRPYMLAAASHWCNLINCDLYVDMGLSKRYFPKLVNIN